MNTKGKSLIIVSMVVIMLLVLSIGSVFSQQGGQQGNKDGQVAAKNPCDELAKHNKEKPLRDPNCTKELQEAEKAYKDWNNVVDKNTPLIEEKKQQIQNKQNMIAALKQALNNERNSEADIKRIQDAIARLEAEIAAIEAEIETLRTEIDAAFNKYMEKVNAYQACLTGWADWEAKKEELETACDAYKKAQANKPQPGPGTGKGPGTTGPTKWSMKVCCEVPDDNPSHGSEGGGPNRYYYYTDNIPPPSCPAAANLVRNQICDARTVCCAYPNPDKDPDQPIIYSLEFGPQCPQPGTIAIMNDCNKPS